MKRSLNTARMNVRVGVMSFISFAILVWILFFPVRGVSPFSSRMKFIGYYERVDGLRRNAPVFYRGMEVGSVESVEVDTDHSDAPLKVVVGVERKVIPLLPKDTTMEIVAQGLLGDVFVDMVPGAKGGSLSENDVLATKPYSSVLAGMNDVADSVKEAVNELHTLLARANAGEGTLGMVVRNDQLYNELVKTVKSIGRIGDDLVKLEDSINEKILDKKTKEGVDAAVATASRVLDNADKLTQKANDLHWYLGVGLNKYEGTLSSSLADLTIVPSKDKFYRGGVEFFRQASRVGPSDYYENLGGYLGYDAYLGLRVLDSPVFFRGGIKDTSVDAGLDFRLNEMVAALPIEINADISELSNPTAKLDLGGSFTFLKVFKLTGGADDVLNSPLWRGGISLIYDDTDLTSILIKSKM
jgi:phospholipid/cholesterol/gamma-HCH transport system substrate-binding protein